MCCNRVHTQTSQFCYWDLESGQCYVLLWFLSKRTTFLLRELLCSKYHILQFFLWVSWKSAWRALTVLPYIVVVKFSAKVTYHILNPLWSSFEKGKLLNGLLKFAPKVQKEKTKTFLSFSEGLIWTKIYIMFWSI